MRLALVIARRHGEDSFTVVVPPGLPHLVREEYHALIEVPASEFGELQMWTSDEGIIKRKSFPPPTETPFLLVPETPAVDTVSTAASPGPSEDAPEDAPEEDGPALPLVEEDPAPRKRGK